MIKTLYTEIEKTEKQKRQIAKFAKKSTNNEHIEKLEIEFSVLDKKINLYNDYIDYIDTLVQMCYNKETFNIKFFNRFDIKDLEIEELIYNTKEYIQNRLIGCFS